MRSTKYVAFLRGINVGGNTIVPMSKLQTLFGELGCTHVKTLLNSGNVLFTSSETNRDKLTKTIEEKLQKIFSFPIAVMLRTENDIRSLVAADPFKSVSMNPPIRCHITFFAEKPRVDCKLPEGTNCKIIAIFDDAICWTIELSPDFKTPDVMKLLEKSFGKTITTRTWNTVVKVSTLLAS